MNDIYYPLIGSTCFGLSPVHHQEHHLIKFIPHWYVRAGKSSCCGLGISKLNPSLQIIELNFQITRFGISAKSKFRCQFQAIIVTILTPSTFSFSYCYQKDVWAKPGNIITKWCSFSHPYKTHVEYRLALSDFNQNRECVDAFSKMSQRRIFTRLGAVSCRNTDMTSLIAALSQHA